MYNFLVYTIPTLEINLDNLVKNYNLASQNEYCGAVVKCNAYGFGAVRVVDKLVKDTTCRDFFVSTPYEALEIKDYAGSSNVYVMNSFQNDDEMNILWSNGFVPICYSIEQVKHWYEKCCKYDIQKTKKPIGIQIETGLNRLGMSVQDLYDVVDNYKDLEIKFIMHHLACGYDVGNVRNHKQLEIMKTINLNIEKSLISSAGLLPDNKISANHMMRLGRFLYGSNENALQLKDHNMHLHTVGRIYAQIISVNHVKSGEYVGYNQDFKADRDTKIAVINVGYGDGCTLKGSVFTNGKFAKVVSYAMDMTMIDVTNIDIKDNFVEILGDNITFDDMAKQTYGARGFEITCCLGSRVQKIYK